MVSTFALCLQSIAVLMLVFTFEAPSNAGQWASKCSHHAFLHLSCRFFSVMPVYVTSSCLYVTPKSLYLSGLSITIMPVNISHTYPYLVSQSACHT